MSHEEIPNLKLNEDLNFLNASDSLKQIFFNEKKKKLKIPMVMTRKPKIYNKALFDKNALAFKDIRKEMKSMQPEHKNRR